MYVWKKLYLEIHNSLKLNTNTNNRFMFSVLFQDILYYKLSHIVS